MAPVARRIGLSVVVVALLAIAGLAWAFTDRPDYSPYASMELPAAKDAPLTVTFVGVSTLLISDGTTHLMTDGFASRPSLVRLVAGTVAPEADRVHGMLKRLDVDKLDAVAVLHAHYDHAMDAPEVARQTGAVVLGCQSVENIARGARLPAAQMRVVEPGVSHRFGEFTLTFVPSAHIDVGVNAATLGGTIDAPLSAPARATAWQEGVTWSLHVAHPSGSMLVQGSAGFVPDALSELRADVVLLGVGLLGKADRDHQEGLLHHVVDAVGARRVIAVHFDDFMTPLDEPLRLFPRFIDDFPAAMAPLYAWQKLDAGRSLALLPRFVPVSPFPRVAEPQ